MVLCVELELVLPVGLVLARPRDESCDARKAQDADDARKAEDARHSWVAPALAWTARTPAGRNR